MILDTTLREGLQRAGAYLDPKGRRQLAEELLASGIPELELGVVGREGFLPSLVAGLAPRNPGARLWVWARLRSSDVKEAARIGISHISVCAPVSAEHLEGRMRWTREQLHERIRETVEEAVSLGMEVQVGLEDASRASTEEILLAARAAARAGAARVRMADTVGILSPGETTDRILSILACDIGAGFHGHDDFGMATANALCALESGAAAVDASLLGWGERAGIAATERLAAYLSVRRGAAFDLERLARAAKDLAGRCSIPIPSHAPVVGEAIFRCETGLHVAALAEHPGLYEPFSPEAVGAKRELRAGGKSGEQAVRKLLEQASPGSTGAPGLVNRIRRVAERLGRPLEGFELVRLAQSSR